MRSSAEFESLVKYLGVGELVMQNTLRLPVCRDPDDQKFLELARDAAAKTLITKDKALLKLAGKCVRAGLFHILTPEKWQINEA